MTEKELIVKEIMTYPIKYAALYSAIENSNWDNASGIKDLLNGKTLNDFSIMFDEAIDCVKGLDI